MKPVNKMSIQELNKELNILENKKGVISNEEIKRLIELRTEKTVRTVWNF